MKDLIIVGAGGFGRELLSVVSEINKVEPTWNVLGFIDDNINALDGYNIEQKVLGTIKDWQPSDKEMFALSIAAPETKKKVAALLREKGAKFANIIHPTATISERTTLGEGVVMFGCVGISVDVKIGDFVFFNAYDGVGHDSVIGDYCTFGPKVCISGFTEMGECVNVGALASTHPGVKVGEHSTIGMNSCAIRRVKPGTTVVGVPAKAIWDKDND